MKFAKLSLATVVAMSMASGAMALDMSKITVKPYVNTKLYYETQDFKGVASGANNSDLFARRSSSGQAFAQIGATGNFNSCWGYGIEYSVADTLGLENYLVNNTRMGASAQDGTILDTQDWMSQAYVTFKGCGTPLANTTFKIGRQYLDTPLAFTETWNVAPNSFDAIVAVNTDIQNVTLVGAYVGKGNGTWGRVTNGERFTEYGTTGTMGDSGAHALGILTNFGLPVNFWYYNVADTAKAWWADANYKFASSGVNYSLGLQYGTMDPKDQLSATAEDTKGGAIKIGAAWDAFTLSAAYSKMNDDGMLALANTATIGGNGLGGKKTKLYTAGIYTDGTGVAVPGSKAVKVAGSMNTAYGKFTLAYVDCKNDVTAATNTNTSANTVDTNVKETDFIYATKVLGINTKLIYINRNVDEAKGATAIGGAYAQDSKHVRVILSKKF